MSLLSWATNQKVRPARWAKRGWIGIDIGTHATKLVQLERLGSNYRIAARWSITDPGHTLTADAAACTTALDNELSKIRTLKRLFSGSKCAAVLPTALVELRSFEVPTGTQSELQRIAGEELAIDLGIEPQELAFDCWEAMSVGRPEPGITRISVSSVPAELAKQLGESLLATGLACQVLDALPCAVARAVELAALELLGDSVIAVDLSYTLPLVVLVKNGRPLYTRTMRGVGLQSIMQPLAAGLSLSNEECEQLLVRYGIVAGGAQPTLASQRTTEIIAHPVNELVNEIMRTVDYIAQQFRSCKPRQVCLFGGGALVKNLPEYISERLDMPAAPWSLAADQADPTDALFGVAAGLSALAWEDAACS